MTTTEKDRLAKLAQRYAEVKRDLSYAECQHENAVNDAERYADDIADLSVRADAARDEFIQAALDDATGRFVTEPDEAPPEPNVQSVPLADFNHADDTLVEETTNELR